jgi:archaellum component FlaC
VWFAATREGLRELLHSSGANLLSDGQVSGMNGLFLGLAKREGFDGICFLGEIPLYTVHMDNPRVSAALLEMAVKLMQIPLDLQGLLDQAQTMEEEINKLLEYFKIGASQSPIGEEEVERLKKTLSQLTRLPVSVREKIEKLFEQTRGDLARAQELKQELDRWNVYKDYEDRFLDLFRRIEENN